MNLRSLITSLAAVLVLAVVSACGGDDNASTTPSATATATGSADDSETPKPTSTSKKTATPKDTGTAEATLAGPDDTTPELDECELLTPDDITAATGEQYSEDGRAGFSDPDTCSFDGEGGGSVDITTLDLSAYEGNEKEFFETFASLLDFEILGSPGDEAYYDDTIGIAVLDGRYEIDIFVQNGTFEPNRDAAFALAEKALANMP